MAHTWQSGCLRIELQDSPGTHSLEELRARFFIGTATADEGANEVQSEGELGIQLAHLLHACSVLSAGIEEEWYVPNRGHPLYLRRQGRQVEIASYPAYIGPGPSWLHNDGLYLVDFGMLIESLSAAVEWVINDLPVELVEDDSVQILVMQWEEAWHHFAQLVTFRRLSLTFA